MEKEIFISEIEETINYLKNKEDYDLNSCIIKVKDTLESNISGRLENRALDELKTNIEQIEKNKPQSIEDVVDLSFEQAYKNGTLTFSNKLTEIELLSEYTLDELLAKKEDGLFNTTEQFHIDTVKEKLTDILEEKYSEVKEEVKNDKKAILVAVYEVLNKDGNYSEKIKELKEEKEKKVIPKKKKEKQNGNER